MVVEVTPAPHPALTPDLRADPIAEARRIGRALLDHVGISRVDLWVARGDHISTSGLAFPFRQTPRIEISVGSCDYGALIETVLHEVTHLIAPGAPGTDGHSEHYWRRLVGLARDLYAVDVEPTVPGDSDWPYACDWRIEEALLGRYRWASAAVPGFAGSPRVALLAHACEVAQQESVEIDHKDLEAVCLAAPREHVVIPLWRAGRVVAMWRFRMPRVLDVLAVDVARELAARVFAETRLDRRAAE